MRQAQELLRHADITTTMKTYTHIEAIDLARQVNSLPQIVAVPERIVVGYESARQIVIPDLIPDYSQNAAFSRNVSRSEKFSGKNTVALEVRKLARCMADECGALRGIEPNTKSQKVRKGGFEPPRPIKGARPST